MGFQRFEMGVIFEMNAPAAAMVRSMPAVQERSKMTRQMVLGVDIGGTHMRTALVEASGGLVHQDRTGSGFDLGPREAIRRLVSQCRGLIELARSREVRVTAVGLGIAGRIDRGCGRVLYSPNLPRLNDFPLAQAVRAELGLPVYLENDANVFGLGEGWLGAGKGIANWIGLTLGTGVGGCVILNDQLWRGDDLGFAGEIGHMNIVPDGPKCACGGSGCLEALASGSALIRGVQEARRKGRSLGPRLRQAVSEDRVSALEVFLAAREGDKLAGELFSRMGWALGLALAGLFSALGIRTAIIGGGVSAAWEAFREALEHSLGEHAGMFPPELAVVKRAELGDEAALIGAARMALESAANRR